MQRTTLWKRLWKYPILITDNWLFDENDHRKYSLVYCKRCYSPCSQILQSQLLLLVTTVDDDKKKNGMRCLATSKYQERRDLRARRLAPDIVIPSCPPFSELVKADFIFFSWVDTYHQWAYILVQIWTAREIQLLRSKTSLKIEYHSHRQCNSQLGKSTACTLTMIFQWYRVLRSVVSALKASKAPSARIVLAKKSATTPHGNVRTV